MNIVVHTSGFSLLSSCSGSVRCSEFAVLGSEFVVRCCRFAALSNLNTNRARRSQKCERRCSCSALSVHECAVVSSQAGGDRARCTPTDRVRADTDDRRKASQ